MIDLKKVNFKKDNTVKKTVTIRESNLSFIEQLAKEQQESVSSIIDTLIEVIKNHNQLSNNKEA